jgi:hypothetical protein
MGGGDAMQQITVIVERVRGQVRSVRVHVGLKSAALVRNYLECLELAQPGLCVEMWPIELYSDIGDVPAGRAPVRRRLTEAGWRRY